MFMKKKIILSCILISLFLVFTAFAGALFFPTTSKVFALEPSNRIMPISTRDSYALTSPVNTYMDDEVTAIVQENNSLVVYKDGKYKLLSQADYNFISLKHVERFDDNSLILSDNGSIYKVNLTSFAVSPLSFGSSSIGGSSFSFNGEILATTYGTNLLLYKASGGAITNMLFTPFSISTDLTVALNSKSVFYISDGKICSRDFSDFENQKVLENLVPLKMVAREDALFYIYDGKIFRYSFADSNSQELTLPESEYDLGKVLTPTDVTFLSDLVVVTDKLNDSVQEFEINGKDLVFTGKAIAKGKTAYNRITAPLSIERYKNILAVLDEHKLTIIDTDKIDYTEKAFTNLFFNDAPDQFAMGKMILVCGKGDSAFIYDITKQSKIDLEIEGNVKDICYKNGYFYILTNHLTASKVYKVSEIDGSINLTKDYNFAYELIEVDALGNYLIVNASGIYKDSHLENGTPEFFAERKGAKEIITDLSGRMYFCNGYDISSLNSVTREWKTYPIGQDSVKDFCLNLDNSTIYFVNNNEEYIYSTDVVDNISVSSIVAPSDLTFTGEQAPSTTLSKCAVNVDAGVYSVEFDNGFKYLDVVSPKNEYLLLKEIPVPCENKLNLYLLADQYGLYLTNKLEGTVSQIEKTTAPKEAFTNTTVHAYYTPLITLNTDHAITLNGQKLMLNKHTKILPTESVNVLGMDFYYCSVEIDGKQVSCYVPINFTVEVLSQNKQLESYSFEQIRATAVYQDQGLTQKICDLKSSTVRVYKNENGVLTIKYYDNGWKDGFIASSSLINTPNQAVRNILIILAVITSICGTASFFILKKFK